MGSRSHALYQCLLADLHCHIGADISPREIESKKFSSWPGLSTRQAACISLLNSILKKFQDELDEGACNERALNLFLEMNDRCESITDIDLEGLDELGSMAIDYSLSRLNHFADQSDGSILSACSILAHLDVGPGASVGVSGNSHYHKFFGGPRTATSSALARLIDSELSLDPSWAEAEKVRASYFGDTKVVRGNALSFALKNAEISRVICTEPSENMKFQKGIQFCLERRLKQYFGIDLSIQDKKNAMLAKIGSETGRFGTADLRSASDTISYALLQKRLPRGFFGWLNVSRSPEVRLPDGTWQKLHMISSMGNAFTFPLQTALFASIVTGCYDALGIQVVYPRGDLPCKGGSLGNFGVFGDDIAVESSAFNLVCRTLERFGFLVNHTKSFNEGSFRESCGSDFWSGHDIRGIYCESLKTAQDVYSLYNQLSAWSCNRAIALDRTLSTLRSWAQDYCVPPWENPDAGFWTPLSKATNVSICPDTGSVLYVATVPKSRRMMVSNRGHDRKMVPTRLSKSGKPKKTGKPYCINNLGFILSASAGYMRGGYITLRNPSRNKPQYQTLSRISPGWDWCDTQSVDRTFDPQGFERWLMAFAQ